MVANKWLWTVLLMVLLLVVVVLTRFAAAGIRDCGRSLAQLMSASGGWSSEAMKNKIRAISVAIGEIGGAKRTAIRDGAYPFISNEVSVLADASDGTDGREGK